MRVECCRHLVTNLHSVCHNNYVQQLVVAAETDRNPNISRGLQFNPHPYNHSAAAPKPTKHSASYFNDTNTTTKDNSTQASVYGVNWLVYVFSLSWCRWI